MNHRSSLILCAALSFGALTLSSTAARADDLYLTPGITLSRTFGVGENEWGVGVECSVGLRSNDDTSTFVGGVIQVQLFTDRSLRVALSAEGSWYIVGAEVGVALRTGTARRDLAFSLRAAPYLSAGYTYVAYDFNLTLGSPRGVAPIEHLGHAALKLPILRVPRYSPGSLSEDANIVGYRWEPLNPIVLLLDH